MPNWCKGILKVRGKKKDLLNFLNKEIERYGYQRLGTNDHIKLSLNVEYDKCGDIFVNKTDGEHNSWLYFKNSRRCFIEENIHWYWQYEEEEEIIQILDIRQAWRLEPDYFKEISKEYNIDFRIMGFECGMEFVQEIEVIKGNITIYEEHTYDNYQWEVYDPRLGG